MLKKALILMLSVGLTMGLGGCTSKKAAEDEGTADVAEVAEEGAEGVEAGDELGGDESVAELGGDELSAEEKLPEDEGGDELAVEEAAPGEGDELAGEGEDELAGSPEEGGDELAADQPTEDQQVAAAEPAQEAAPEATPEPTPEPSMEPTPEPMAMDAPAEDSEPKQVIPLRKMADAPYEQSGTLVNAIYIARKGDNLKDIASRIYGGSDRINELVKLNPTFKHRDVKVGDKVYYNSPNRPTDNTRLLTYYEDNGLAPEVYQVSKPENIRDIAKQVLGHSDSWKELWATNLDVESKGELPEGTQLRYWAATPSAPLMANAGADQSQGLPEQAPAPETAAMAQPEPPPAPDQQAAMTPPPMEAAEPPPPPPPVESLPPPPPPTMAETAPPPPPGETGGEAPGASDGSPLAMIGLDNPDQTMAMGAGAILLVAAVGLFVVIRKRRRRQHLDFHTSTQTQIE